MTKKTLVEFECFSALVQLENARDMQDTAMTVGSGELAGEVT